MTILDKIRRLTNELDRWEETDSQNREREKFLILNGLTDMVLVIDQEGFIKFANPASYRIAGYDPIELQGKNVTILMSKEDEIAHNTKIDNYVHGGHSPLVMGKGRNIKVKHKNGGYVNAHIYVGELCEDGACLFIGIIHKVNGCGE